jgi:hypothetical protein
MAQNRIMYRTSQDPKDPCMMLLRQLNEGGCIKYFKLDNYDRRNPPPGVQHFPAMYIIGSPRLLIGQEAFQKAYELIEMEKQKRNLAQQMSVQYHQKRMLLQQQLTNSRDNLLGFSEREMTNFSDSYSTVTADAASLPQSFQAPVQNAKMNPNGEIVMIDGIVTPQLPTHTDSAGRVRYDNPITADEQSQRIAMLKAERDKQRSIFESSWESDKQMKLQQLNSGQSITAVSQQNQFPIQGAQQPITTQPQAPQMPGMVPQMPGMMQQMPGMVTQMPGMMPQMQQMVPGMMQQMVPGMMPQMQQMMPGMMQQMPQYGR